MMKTIKVLSSFLVFFCLGIQSFAQKLEKVQTAYVIKKYEDAKAEIDRLGADPKAATNPEYWLWTATVYGILFEDSALNVKYPAAREYSYYAFSKYKELDPTYKLMTESAIPGKKVVESLYKGSWNVGYNEFYDAKKYDSSFKYLSRTVEILDLIAEKGWIGKRQPLDTISILFTAYSAINNKKNDLAVPYAKRLADTKVVKVPYVGDTKGLYAFLLQYYTDQKDVSSFNSYLTLFRQLYPTESAMWDDYETIYAEKNLSLAERLQIFDKADQAGKLSSNQYMAYGSMFYSAEDKEDKLDSSQKAMYRSKAEYAFTKAYEKDNTMALAAYNVGLMNYNQWVELDDVYQGNIRKMGDINRNKPAEKDPKKKAAIDAKAKKEVEAVKADNLLLEKKQHLLADKGSQWLETAYKILSVKANLERSEKNYLNKIIDDLANLYLWKRDRSKGNAAEYDKYDALYKKYDALHGKF